MFAEQWDINWTQNYSQVQPKHKHRQMQKHTLSTICKLICHLKFAYKTFWSTFKRSKGTQDRDDGGSCCSKRAHYATNITKSKLNYNNDKTMELILYIFYPFSWGRTSSSSRNWLFLFTIFSSRPDSSSWRSCLGILIEQNKKALLLADSQ